MTFEEIFGYIIPQKEQTINRFSGCVDLIEKYVRKFPTDQNWLRFKEIANDENWSEMEMVAHTLKGYAGNLGLDSLFNSCSDVVAGIREKNFDKAKDAIMAALSNGAEIEKYISQLD